MMTNFIGAWRWRLLGCTCLLLAAVCTGHTQADSLARFGISPAQEAAAQAWLDDLYTMGVEIKGDSVHFNDEARRIVTDSNYRKAIYPEQYTWPAVQVLLHKMALKPAFWYLINLYLTDAERQDLVLQMVLPFDQLMEVDRVLLATYYTYIAFDPQVYVVENGRTTAVQRPDLAEQKLLATKAIVEAVWRQRNLNSQKE